MSLPDTFHLFPGGEPVAVTVTATALPLVTDIDRPGMVTYLGEVCVGGEAVFGHRTVVFDRASPDLARRRAQEQTVHAFAERLRGLLGYDPRAARGL